MRTTDLESYYWSQFLSDIFDSMDSMALLKQSVVIYLNGVPKDFIKSIWFISRFMSSVLTFIMISLCSEIYKKNLSDRMKELKIQDSFYLIFFPRVATLK